MTWGRRLRSDIYPNIIVDHFYFYSQMYLSVSLLIAGCLQCSPLESWTMYFCCIPNCTFCWIQYPSLKLEQEEFPCLRRQRYWAWCVHLMLDPVFVHCHSLCTAYTQLHYILYCTNEFCKGPRFNWTKIQWTKPLQYSTLNTNIQIYNMFLW